MSKSILYVSPVSFHGGAEEVLLSYMQVAQEVGYSPVLIAPSPGWLTGECQIRDYPVELLPSLPGVSLPHATNQFLPMAWNGLQIARIARKLNAAIIHSNSPRASYHGGLGARIAGIAAVTHIHDVINPPYKSTLKSKLLYTLTDWTIAVSNAVRQEIISYAPIFRNRISTIYNGGVSGLYKKTLQGNLPEIFNFPRNAIVLISASVISEHKGQHLLISAFKYLRAKHNNLRLLIVGSAQNYLSGAKYEISLRQMVVNDGLEKEILFTGWREDVIALIKAADILLHTPTMFDSLPNVLLHGIALGRAVVATNTGGIPEIIVNGQNGYVVEPDPKKIAEAIDKLLTDPRIRQQFGRNAEERYRTIFSYENMRNELGDIYERVQKGISRKILGPGK